MLYSLFLLPFSFSLSLSQTIKPQAKIASEQRTTTNSMAVEARHMNLFPSQYITNRDLMNINIQGNKSEMQCCIPTSESVLPFYESDWVQAKTSMKSDSGLTYNLPAPRKRCRDCLDEFNDNAFSHKNMNLSHQFSSFLGQDIFFHIQQQQSEIDHAIAQHTEKVRMEVYERRKRQSRMLVTAIEEGMMKKVKEKEEEIERMGKLNWVLQERVKSLYVENQIWRELAQTNEATANSLRTNLEQVLAHVSEDGLLSGGGGGGGGAADDAESCCDSSEYNGNNEGKRCTLEAAAGVKDKRMCRKCGEKESCVLLLPCRHLCLCNLCGSTLHTCPLCNSNTTATLHVNMS